MTTVRNVRDLHAWQIAMNLVELTYTLTGDFPIEERYGLTSQMRRCAISIPSNIAEGQGVARPRWTLRHVLTAIGSSWELDTQLAAALRLGFATPDATTEITACLDRVQKLLYGMRREKERRLAIPIVTTIVFVAYFAAAIA